MSLIISVRTSAYVRPGGAAQKRPAPRTLAEAHGGLTIIAHIASIYSYVQALLVQAEEDAVRRQEHADVSFNGFDLNTQHHI